MVRAWPETSLLRLRSPVLPLNLACTRLCSWSLTPRQTRLLLTPIRQDFLKQRPRKGRPCTTCSKRAATPRLHHRPFPFFKPWWAFALPARSILSHVDPAGASCVRSSARLGTAPQSRAKWFLLSGCGGIGTLCSRCASATDAAFVHVSVIALYRRCCLPLKV